MGSITKANSGEVSCLDAKSRQLYEDYQLIQYDILQGKQYSLQTDLFG